MSASGRTPGRKKPAPPAKASKARAEAKPKPRPRRAASAPRRRVGRPPGKASAETRAAILASACEEFVRVGYERATNKAIAAKAGVTAAAIYQYFASKSELYLAVMAENQELLMPRLRATVDAAPSARAALVGMMREHLLVEQNLVATRFLAAIPIEMQRHPELAAAVVAQPGTIFDLVLQVIRRGVREGEIARDRAEQVVAAYIAGQIGLAIHMSTMPPDHARAAVDGFIALLEGRLFER